MNRTQDAILARLSESRQPLSGDRLAAEFGLSRAGIWKHIQALRNRGIRIASHSGRGYSLESDILSAAALESAMAGRHIGSRCLLLDETDSTNAEAMRQAERGADDGLAIFARRQQRGRGRLGRSWHTAEGDALACSILLRPPLPPEQVPQISLLAAVALHDAASRFAPEVRLKWPNDLLHRGAKLAGILTEMRGEPGRVHAVVLGIGLNLRTPAAGWPAAITQAVTDLTSASGRNVSQLEVAIALLEAIDRHYRRYLEHGFAPVREAWWQRHAASEQSVRVHHGKGYIEGIAEALDEDGALLLRTTNGTERIIAGDLELL